MNELLIGSSSLLAAGAEAGHHEPSFLGVMVYLLIVIAIMMGLLLAAKKGLKDRVFKNKLTQATEQLYLFLENMALGIIGPHGKRYLPMLMTFWLFIFLSNVLGLFMDSTPTSILSVNLGMALISIGYVQWEGMKSNGFFGHWSHFAGPKLPIVLVPITLMIFVIEIISEVMKNVSLSLRLFGNIHGGHQAALAMNELGAGWVPVGAFLMPIKLLTCVVQAMIFTLLTCVYISLVTHHEGDHGHDEDHAPAAAH
ncbi:MAG: F0F1 ATP synthase subunit A [Armatimonadetes bacterium]|nr:F0F1 ATP synthase subunit A [Armatimonadota bacterium]